MRVVWILSTLVTLSMGQFVFPDEYEAMQSSTARPESLQANLRPVNNAINTVNVNAGFSAPSSRGSPPSNQLDPVWNNRANSVISKGIANFALEMDNAVSTSSGRFVSGSRENVIFSPLSIAGALALVLLGSGGRTFDEVSSILGFNAGVDLSRNSEVVHQMFGILIDAVAGRSTSLAAQSYFASGIFVRNGYPIRPEFQSISQNVYKSEVINLDFANRGGNAQEFINSWVNSKTRGKISSILNEPPPAETNVIIASALYFKAEWNQHFFDGVTRKKNFTISPGESVQVDMMYNGGEFPFFEDRQLQAKILGLPYKGREVTMYVVLPTGQGVEALRTVERSLNAERLENLIQNMRNETCIIGLPRMKLSSTLSLRGALQSLGLVSLFDPSTADLSLLSPGYTSGSPTSNYQPPITSPLQRPSQPVQGNDMISFPTRLNGQDEDTSSPQPDVSQQPGKTGFRQNYFSYDDRVRGYHVEQWATGFRIGKIGNQRNRRSSRSNQKSDKSQINSSVKNGLKQRRKRQVQRPINREFLNYMGNQNRPSYGLDNLRNSGPLVNPGLYADEVLHRVEIEITETGTEAAAVTAVTLTKDGSQKRFIADHPFLFFIRQESTGLLLFWGTVNKPTPNYP